MKKVIGIVGAVLLMSSSLNASTIAKDVKEEATVAYFCDAGWGAIDGYYDAGGDDGFVAAQIFALACS